MLSRLAWLPCNSIITVPGANPIVAPGNRPAMVTDAGDWLGAGSNKIGMPSSIKLFFGSGFEAP
jgi:hypothetical protein